MAGAGEVRVAKETFVAYDDDGNSHVIHKGQDRAREGSWIVEKYPDQFEALSVQYDVEQATAHPGEKRGSPLDEGGGADDAGEPDPTTVAPPEDNVTEVTAAVRPGDKAVKADWVKHAVEDHGVPPGEAEALTIAALKFRLYPDEYPDPDEV